MPSFVLRKQAERRAGRIARFGCAAHALQQRYLTQADCRVRLVTEGHKDANPLAAGREVSTVIQTGLILVALCCVVVYVMMKRGELPRLSKGNSGANPYERARQLLSSTHAAFFDLLEQALDDRYRVFGNVRLTDVVDIRSDLNRKQRQSALKRLPPFRLDFVICEKENASIVGAVMVEEGETEPGGVRAQQETALDGFLATVGIPIARLSGKRDYSIEDLRIEVSRALFLKWKDGVPASGTEGTAKPLEKNDIPYDVCPACGLPFVKRIARKGTYAGKVFLTCSNYPECKHVQLIKDKSALMKAQNLM
jgi:ssDNA-binding Zn-finger/Zn-ribbon topoisomerase 1